MRLGDCCQNNGMGLNLIRADIPEPTSLDTILHRDMLVIRKAPTPVDHCLVRFTSIYRTVNRIFVSCLACLVSRRYPCCLRRSTLNNFKACSPGKKFSMPLLARTHLDCIRGGECSQKSKSNMLQHNIKELSLSVMRIESEPKRIAPTPLVVIKAMCERFLLVYS